MTRQNARDLAFGRRGGGWAENSAPADRGRPCQVCGKPMLAGQRNRHGVCSPRLECCGAYTDLVPGLDKHAKAHAEMDVARK